MMKTRILWGIFGIVGAGFSQRALVANATRPAPKIDTVKVVATPNDIADCWSKNKHGNVVIEYSNRQRVTLNRRGAALQNTRDADEQTNGAQISPDRQTVGWTEGVHQPCVDWSVGGTMFVNSRLVLWRNGRQHRVLDVPRTFIEGWRFWNNGKYVAIGSRWHHGVGYVRLFDVRSGKLLERMTTPEANAKKLRWAKNLTD